MDVLIFILFGGIISFYVIYFAFRKKIKLNEKFFNFSIKIHYLTFGLMMCRLILKFFNLYFIGNWTTEIIMWFFLTTNFIIQFRTEYLKTTLEKTYFKILLISPSVLVLTWIIPMLGAYVSYSFMLLFNTYDDKIIYNDTNFKLSYQEGFLLHDNEFEVYKKIFLFEKEIKKVSRDEIDFEKINKVKLLNENQLKIEYIEYGTNIKKDTIINLKNKTSPKSRQGANP
jgi:hypothetical protein